MAHPENETPAQAVLDLIEAHATESFRMAERIILARAKVIEWKDDAARDRYLSSIPLFALDLKAHLSEAAGMLANASSAQIDRFREGLSTVLDELRRRNDQADKLEETP